MLSLTLNPQHAQHPKCASLSAHLSQLHGDCIMHQQAYFLPLDVMSKGLIRERRHLGKVATIIVQLEVMQMDDVCGDDIEEVSIMRHHDQRLLPTLQVLLQHSTETLKTELLDQSSVYN